jgi:hypothetical protein
MIRMNFSAKTLKLTMAVGDPKRSRHIGFRSGKSVNLSDESLYRKPIDSIAKEESFHGLLAVCLAKIWAGFRCDEALTIRDVARPKTRTAKSPKPICAR